MENKQPLLSICIPTYNRAKNLEKSLNSLVRLPESQLGNIEIVVSDNASTDNTEIIVKTFANEYPYIHYFKNKKNIRDENFPKVLSEAKGVYRKLSNDSLIYEAGALNRLLEIVTLTLEEKPIIFWKNSKKNRSFVRFGNADSFLRKASFFTTSIATFGLWQEDCCNIEDKIDGTELSLWQTKFLFDLLAKNKNRKILYVKDNLFYVQTISKKDLSYGLYKVFYINYLSLLNNLVEKKIIQKRTYNFLKKDLFFNFFLTWLVRYQMQKDLYRINDSEHLETLVFDQCKGYVYYWALLFKYKKRVAFARIRRKIIVKKEISLAFLKKSLKKF